MEKKKTEASLRPLFERFLLWADQCPDVRAAFIEWPENRVDRSRGSAHVRITVITAQGQQDLSMAQDLQKAPRNQTVPLLG